MAEMRLRLPRLVRRQAENQANATASGDGSDRAARTARLLGRARSAGGAAEARARAGSSLITARRLRLVLWLVLVLVLVLVPGRCARDAITELAQETAAIASVTAADEAEVQRLQSLEDARTEFERDYAAVQAAMPEQPALPEMIEQLVALEASTGVRLLEVSPGQPAPIAAEEGSASSEVLQLALGLSVVGDEGAVLEFIEGLRGLPRLIVVDNVGLTWRSDLSTQDTAAESGPQAAPPRLEANMTARMFMWARGTAAPR